MSKQVIPGPVEGPLADNERLKRESEREMRKLANAGYKAPAGKPDKRARRLIQALGDLDAL